MLCESSKSAYRKLSMETIMSSNKQEQLIGMDKQFCNCGVWKLPNK